MFPARISFVFRGKKIPFRKVGTRRRVLFQDLSSYKAKIDAARRKTLDELTEEAQNLDMEYYFKVPKDLVVSIEDTGKPKIGISCSHLSLFMSLNLIKQREAAGYSIDLLEICFAC